MKEVWFIRHGESESNAGHPTASTKANGLTQRGVEEARLVAKAITSTPSLIVSSNYCRTKQTAKYTREVFPEVVYQEWNIQEFTYLATSRVENSTAVSRQPIINEYWNRADPLYLDGEGAESFMQFIERVNEARNKLLTIDSTFTIIFSHGLFMRAMIWLNLSAQRDATPSKMKEFWHFTKSTDVPNASILKALILDTTSLYVASISTAHLGI